MVGTSGPITFSRWKKRYLMADLDAMMGAKTLSTDEIEKWNQRLELIIGGMYIVRSYKSSRAKTLNYHT